MSNTLNTSLLKGPQFYKFSDCFLDTVERRLFKKNKRLDITPKALEVLQVLVENAGEVVSKDELLGQIWGDSFVEESNLPVQISKLRSELCASKDEPYIVTESGVGYKFVARVSVVEDDEWIELIENELAEHKDGKQKFTSIAVMPLVTEGADDDIEYLADGITESIINSLSEAKDLRVIARNSVFQFKNTEIDIKKLGRKLRVTTMLTGRIRIVREKIVISVELSKVADGTQIWGIRLNKPFDDIFEVQDKLSSAIAKELELKVAEYSTSKKPSTKQTDPDTFRYYLKGKHYRRIGGADNLKKAIENFNFALAFDPTYPEIYFELASCYVWLCAYDIASFQQMDRMITRMLEKAEILNGTRSKLLYLKGLKELHSRHDFKQALKYFEDSLAVDQTSLACNFSYANLLVNMGRTSESLFVAQKLLRLDPISSDNVRNISKIFYKAEQYEAAAFLLEESLELEPLNYETMILLAANLIEIGDYSIALEYIDCALDIQDHVELQALKCYAYAKTQDFVNANKLLDMLMINTSEACNVPDTYLAIIHSELGHPDLAFEHINRGIEKKHLDILSLRVDPRFSRLRADGRFKTCLDRIGI